MDRISKQLVDECKARLIQAKAEILNRTRASRLEFTAREKGGDEADQSVSTLAEHEFLTTQERMRFQLTEIEAALARIARGQFGVCEETEEPIEPERLLAIPWTRLSIEGAEIRESLQRRYAR